MKVYILRKSEFYCGKMDKFKKQLIATGAVLVAMVPGYITIREVQEHKEFTVPSVRVTSQSGQSYTLEQQLDNQTYDKNYKWTVKDRKLILDCFDSELSANALLHEMRDSTHAIYTYPWSAMNFFPTHKNSYEPMLRFSLGDIESDYSAENNFLRIEIDEANSNCSAAGLSFNLRQ
jgi:hypothetical protein